MGRSLASALAVVGALLALALVDGGRETEPLSPPLAAATPDAPAAPTKEVAAPSEDIGIGEDIGGSLIDCLDAQPAGSTPPLPGLTPGGVDEVAGQVERLRRLSFDGPVDVRFLSPDGINREVSGMIDEEADPERIRRGGEALELLGAIPPGSDLLELSRAALDSQVLGLYVPGTGELLVSRSGEAGAVEAITVAHELDHALTDEALGLPLPERTRPGRGDRDLAALALVEGDATLLMSLYTLRFISAEEQLSLLSDPSVSGGGAALEDLPYVIRAQLLFPYEAGLEYVCELYSEGGWKAVDAAYRNPPRSTAELLDPSAGSIELTEPPPPPDPDGPWRPVLADSIGAAELSWLFEAPGDDPAAAIPDPTGNAADWRGGRIALWSRGDDRALGLSIAERRGGSLCEAMTAWYGAANPDAELARVAGGVTFAAPGKSAEITCSPGLVRVLIGPDPETVGGSP